MTTKKQNLSALAALIHAQHVEDDAHRAQALSDLGSYTPENIQERARTKAAVYNAATAYGEQYWHTCQALGIDWHELDAAVETLDTATESAPMRDDPDLWSLIQAAQQETAPSTEPTQGELDAWTASEYAREVAIQIKYDTEHERTYTDELGDTYTTNSRY